MFYPNQAYYEWFHRDPDGDYIGLEDSVAYLVRYINNNGPFDGVLGFSQGASMVTRLVQLQHDHHPMLGGEKLFDFVILVGAVPPLNLLPVRFIVECVGVSLLTIIYIFCTEASLHNT